jgi:hypothetical protein
MAIASRPGAFAFTISPVAFRFFITAPAGKLSPIYLAQQHHDQP